MRIFARLKKEAFYLRKAVFQYRAGARYLYNKFMLAPKILHSKAVFQTLDPEGTDALSIHVLTGQSDLTMCLWSLASFFSRSMLRGQLFIHSDGTLRAEDEVKIKRLFSQARVVDPQQAATAVAEFFRDYRDIPRLRMDGGLILLKKLLDPIAVSKSKMRLVIDSDLVWFKRPEDLETAVGKSLPRPLMMKNNGTNYVRFRDGTRISEVLAGFNSGIVAFRPEQFSLPRLEEYFSKLDLGDTKTPHFIEQAGYAYALSEPEGLPSERYTIKGEFSEILALKHYTNPRRPLFYLEALPKLEKLFLKA